MSGFNPVGVTQEQVPGEPVFVVVKDASHDAKNVKSVITVSLAWLQEQVAEQINDSRFTFEYIELYVLFPPTGDFPKFPGLVRCDVGTLAGKNPGDGLRLILSNHIGILWSCDL